jgi:CheY-like chemotaxis protein
VLKNLLLVEDLEDDVILFKIVLGQIEIDHTLQIKPDGAQAIEYLSALLTGNPGCRPDLILLDIKMPGIDGFGILTWIRQQVQLLTVPVVMLTSSAEHGDMLKAISLGANSYLFKTGNIVKFRKTLQLTLQYWFEAHQQPAAV